MTWSSTRNLGASIVLLCVGSVNFVLKLSHGVSPGGRFCPLLAGVSSAVQVEFGEVQEFSSLGNILLVVGVLLGVIGGTNLFVLSLA